MKKKVFCALLCTAMVASLTACGGSSSSTAADTSSDAAAEETTEAADDTAEADTADATHLREEKSSVTPVWTEPTRSS